MKKTKKFIKLAAILMMCLNFYCSSNALNKKNIFRPTKKMFERSSIEKNEIENFSIVLNKKPNIEINGPTAQIFTKSFIKQISKDFKLTNEFDISKYIDDSDMFSVEKKNLKDKFVINIDFNKKKVDNEVIKRFRNYMYYIENSKFKLSKLAESVVKDVNSNFEKYRSNLNKDLEYMEKYTTNREKIFNSAVSGKKKNFVKDFKNFAEIMSNSYEIYNEDRSKNARELYRIARKMRRDANSLNINSQIFRMYKEKILGPSKEEVKKFVRKYKNNLSRVKKKDVVNCCNSLIASGIKVNRN